MSPSAAVERPAATALGRLVSLDVLRGATIAFMILVNNSGNRAYWPLQHSDWNGWTPTDLVFPIFLFLMGASIVFSFESRLGRGASRSSLLLHTLKRFVILFLLGLLVNGFPLFHWETLRIYGVLQRIALCFLACALPYLVDRRVASKAVIILSILIGYWILLRWVPVPGYGRPGAGIPFLDKNANWVAYLDRHIFPGRLFEGTRDPEGLLSTLPAIATTLMGMLTGIWLRGKRLPLVKCAGMLGAGIFCTLLGELWSPWFPLNKNLWTSSYVLFTAGIALIAWAFCYWASEIKGWKRGWTFFWVVFGRNAITAYVFSELLAAAIWETPVYGQKTLSQIIAPRLYGSLHRPQVAALVYALCFVLVCWLPMLWLHRKKIFIKV